MLLTESLDATVQARTRGQHIRLDLAAGGTC